MFDRSLFSAAAEAAVLAFFASLGHQAPERVLAFDFISARKAGQLIRSRPNAIESGASRLSSFHLSKPSLSCTPRLERTLFNNSKPSITWLDSLFQKCLTLDSARFLWLALDKVRSSNPFT